MYTALLEGLRDKGPLNLATWGEGEGEGEGEGGKDYPWTHFYFYENKKHKNAKHTNQI